ncbi:uncharacterized protein SOCEGT47_019490 [Sorangium cellulosum]|uniref:Uncharacterized protein n=1 Tax=Sorangium cellulosum TaxID=56 RepID=A0A4P2PX73_SORCE|nr:hypothetical protein [Sorangium cellulosum]AUX21465.1 uncharacterized protein SOCEGT47_019490 [Sorangium cellulosum]
MRKGTSRSAYARSPAARWLSAAAVAWVAACAEGQALGPRCEAPEVRCGDGAGGHGAGSDGAGGHGAGSDGAGGHGAGSDGAGGHGAGGDGAGGAGGTPPGCGAVPPPQDIGSTTPQRVRGTTLGADDRRALSCSGPGAADRTFLFTAPLAGTYLFDTFEADHDTVLGALRADTCAELACNDDAAGIAPQIAVDLAEGEPILVVVSGADGAQGDFTLHVSQPGPHLCAPTALDRGVPQAVTGTTRGLEDAVYSGCADGPSPDATFTFTAKDPGVHVFTARGADDLSLDVLDGDTCLGALLGCDFRFGEAKVAADLEAGQTVLLAVATPIRPLEAFALEITQAPPCPRVHLDAAVPQTVTGSNEGLPDVFSTCATPESGGEATYGFSAPDDGLYTFDVRGADFPAVLSLRDATCTGEALACLDGSPGVPARATVPLAAGQTVVAVVDSHGEAGAHALEITRTPCPLLDLGATVPQVVTGSTEGRADLLRPSCGAGSGGEVTYRFTAPSDGTFVFDTAGSALETVLSVRTGGCGGPEIACSSGGTGSRAIVPLVAGQAVLVSVDSNGAEGAYVLEVRSFDGRDTGERPSRSDPRSPGPSRDRPQGP